jgi:hypothetical protein
MHRFATGGTIIATLMEIVTVGQERSRLRHFRKSVAFFERKLP